MPLKSPRSPSCFNVCVARIFVAKGIALLLLLHQLPYFLAACGSITACYQCPDVVDGKFQHCGSTCLVASSAPLYCGACPGAGRG